MKVERNWNYLKGSQRASQSLNPIRNWLETHVTQNEKIANAERPRDKITFCLGDPTLQNDFKTPENYIQIVQQAVGKIDGYTDFFGDVNVRKQLAKQLSSQKWQLSQDDVILTSGGSVALYYALLSIVAPGESLLMPKPTFPLLKGFADLFGINIVFYNLIPGTWQPDFNQLDELMNDSIKMILVNSPSNPQGSLFSDESIKKLMKCMYLFQQQVCEKHKIPILSDEIYEEMIYEGDYKFISEYSDNVPIIRASGLTKKCLVPGWRMGWLAFYGKDNVFSQVKKAIRNLSSILLMPNTICQAALNEVYELSLPIVKQKMILLKQRCDLIKELLANVPGLSVGETFGALYTSIIIDPTQFRDIQNSKQFAIALQIEENVLVFPGELFYGENFIRLVICSGLEEIHEACQRIKRFVNNHI